MADQTNAEPEYRNKLETVPVGDKYAEVELSDGTVVRRGDVVVFDDPDIGHSDHERGVTSRIFVGFVEAIGDMNHIDEPELFITAGIGRVGVNDNYVHISGEGVRPDPDSGVQKFIEQFLNEADISGDEPFTNSDVREMRIEWRNGKAEREFYP